MIRFWEHELNALLDTGSDITIAGRDFTKKYDWEIYPHPAKTVKIANGECMTIYGAAQIPLSIGERSVDSKILISPDMNGVDWLE